MSMAKLSELRAKGLKELFAPHTIYLLRKDGIYHLLHGISDWTIYNDYDLIGQWNMYSYGGKWYAYTDANPHGEFLSFKDMIRFINDAEICMMGKGCTIHS